jgi:glutamyl-tRNA reductase|nr:MAG: glutamyl-tRNA reductase [Vulcanisaeta sp. AZ3]
MTRIKALVMTYRDFDLDTLTKAYFTNNELEDLYGIYESMVALETCNRIEFYLDGDEDEARLIGIIKDKAGVEPKVLRDLDAVRHLLLVTAGLDSMFLGEREVLSQVKRAYSMGRPSNRLKILFESAIRFGESFRHRHNLTEISFIKFLSDFVMRNTNRGDRILVIGGGEVARGVVRELLRSGYGDITVANRTLDKLRYEFGGSVRMLSLDSLRQEVMVSEYDVLVAAISVSAPILEFSDGRYRVPNLIIDVSTPSAIKVPPTITKVFRLEDLREPYLKYVNGKSRILDNLGEIDSEAERIMKLIIRSDADEIVRDVMKFVEEIRREEANEAINALRNGQKPEEVVEVMSRSLVKKMMHNYLENIRRLIESDDEEAARRLRDYLTKV